MTPVPSAAEGVRLVVFALDEQRYAVELTPVEQVLPMVALAAFPRAPEIVAGVFNLHGELVPVINLRRRFRRPERPPAVGDHLLVVQTPKRRLALLVDRVEPVHFVPASVVTASGDVLPGLEYLKGVVPLPDHGIIFVHDLDALLSLDEESRLTTALAEVRA